MVQHYKELYKAVYQPFVIPGKDDKKISKNKMIEEKDCEKTSQENNNKQLIAGSAETADQP